LQIIEDVILYRRADATDDLIALAEKKKEELEANKQTGSQHVQEVNHEAWRDLPLEERLAYALRKGIGEWMKTDLGEALHQYPDAVSIIEGPLMKGMSEVGELFGAGKMFLPQVVKTARTMKQAVAFLQPYIEAGKKQGAAKAGKVLLATVKGDVHDIGKNIVGVVMACNNYEVIDLGVMVPAEQIVKKAQELHADIVGLSGLITPSLEEMVHVAQEMDKAGLHIPIMIGGATTSQLHVALKIAPVYQGPVVWMKDASQNVPTAHKLLDTKGRKHCEDELKERYQKLRSHYKEQQELLSLEEARKRKPNLFE